MVIFSCSDASFLKTLVTESCWMLSVCVSTLLQMILSNSRCEEMYTVRGDLSRRCVHNVMIMSSYDNAAPRLRNITVSREELLHHCLVLCHLQEVYLYPNCLDARKNICLIRRAIEPSASWSFVNLQDCPWEDLSFVQTGISVFVYHERPSVHFMRHTTQLSLDLGLQSPLCEAVGQVFR